MKLIPHKYMVLDNQKFIKITFLLIALHFHTVLPSLLKN